VLSAALWVGTCGGIPAKAASPAPRKTLPKGRMKGLIWSRQPLRRSRFSRRGVGL
jgi:hypothetical protein